MEARAEADTAWESVLLHAQAHELIQKIFTRQGPYLKALRTQILYIYCMGVMAGGFYTSLWLRSGNDYNLIFMGLSIIVILLGAYKHVEYFRCRRIVEACTVDLKESDPIRSALSHADSVVLGIEPDDVNWDDPEREAAVDMMCNDYWANCDVSRPVDDDVIIGDEVPPVNVPELQEHLDSYKVSMEPVIGGQHVKFVKSEIVQLDRDKFQDHVDGFDVINQRDHRSTSETQELDSGGLDIDSCHVCGLIPCECYAKK